MRIRMIMAVLTLAALVGFSPGCAQTKEQSAQLQQAVDFNNGLRAGIAATAAAAPAIDASIAALPDGKVKTEAVKISAGLKNDLQTAATLTDGAGKVLVAAQSGDPVATGVAVTGALSAVPGSIGTYAALAGILVTSAFGVYKSISASRATAAAAAADSQAQAHLEAAQTAQQNLQKVVNSIDVAGVMKLASADQKETIKKVQGPETSAVVEQIKAGG